MERNTKFKFGMLTCAERSDNTVKAHLKNVYEVKRFSTDKGIIEKDITNSVLEINRAIQDIKETLGEIKKNSGYYHRARTPSCMSVSDASCSSLSNKLLPKPFSVEAKHIKHSDLMYGLGSNLCSRNNEDILKRAHRRKVTSNSPDSGYQSSDLREERCMSDGTSVVSPSQNCEIHPSPKTLHEKEFRNFRGITPTSERSASSSYIWNSSPAATFHAGTGSNGSETSGDRQYPTPKLLSEYNSDVMNPESAVFPVPIITIHGHKTERSAPVTHMNESMNTAKTTQYILSKMTLNARRNSHQTELFSENPSSLAKQRELCETPSKHNLIQNIRESVSSTRKLLSKSAASMSYAGCVRDEEEFQPGTPKSLGDEDCINSRQTHNPRRLREVLVRAPAYSLGTRDSAKVIMSKSAIQRSLNQMTLEYNKPRSITHLEKERQKLLHARVTAFVNLLFMDGKCTL